MIYNINYSHVKKTILFRKNLQQTMRLLLLNVFALKKLTLIFFFHELYDDCFFLFKNLLFKSEQKKLTKKNDSKFRIVSNVTHQKSSAISRLESKYCREILELFIKSSTNEHSMFVVFKIAFRETYVIDYAMFNIMHFDNAVIQ